MEARRAGGPREETIWAGAQMEARRAGMMWDETIGAGAGGLCDVRRGYRSADGGHGRPECCEARPLECRLRPEGLSAAERRPQESMESCTGEREQERGDRHADYNRAAWHLCHI